MKIKVSHKVLKFPGKGGWHYVPLTDAISSDLREVVKSRWPALLAAELKVGDTDWKSSIMPIKDGPLFIALPAKVRKAENIKIGDKVVVEAKVNLDE